MDEKTTMPPLPALRTLPGRRRSRQCEIIALATFIVFMLLHIRPLAHYASARLSGPDAEGLLSQQQPLLSSSSSDGAEAKSRKVPLEAHIMSKCPDARDCLQDLILPVMMRVQDKVDFTMSYVGTPTENDGVDCKHGPAECLGNILFLCAASLYDDPKKWMGFIMCMERDFRDIPDKSLVQDCALEHAVDFDALNECATQDDGGLGMGMLRNSTRRTIDVGRTP